jgi:hypothetical protein
VPWRELKPVGTGFRLDRPALPLKGEFRDAIESIQFKVWLQKKITRLPASPPPSA